MRHYAHIDENNIVTTVCDFGDTETPIELGWPNWYETASNIRKKFASPGDKFVLESEDYPLGFFYTPDPPIGKETWVLNAEYEFEPPADKPYPEGFGVYPNTWWWDPMIQDWDQRTPVSESE
tara:strand:- start:187 stop:552 length:366 start_codon:yes stop_codon:yes gene_type:complete